MAVVAVVVAPHGHKQHGLLDLLELLLLLLLFSFAVMLFILSAFCVAVEL